MLNRILVCLDHSLAAEQVLPYVTTQAKKFGCKVVLLHVCKKDFNSFQIPASGQSGIVPIELILQEFSYRSNQAELYLKQIANVLESERIDTETVVIEGYGPVAESISIYAKENDIDLIAMASRERKGLKRLLFRSVAASLAKMTAIPILLVKTDNNETNSHLLNWLSTEGLAEPDPDSIPA